MIVSLRLIDISLRLNLENLYHFNTKGYFHGGLSETFDYHNQISAIWRKQRITRLFSVKSVAKRIKARKLSGAIERNCRVVELRKTLRPTFDSALQIERKIRRISYRPAAGISEPIRIETPIARIAGGQQHGATDFRGLV